MTRAVNHRDQLTHGSIVSDIFLHGLGVNCGTRQRFIPFVIDSKNESPITSPSDPYACSIVKNRKPYYF